MNEELQHLAIKVPNNDTNTELQPQIPSNIPNSVKFQSSIKNLKRTLDFYSSLGLQLPFSQQYTQEEQSERLKTMKEEQKCNCRCNYETAFKTTLLMLFEIFKILMACLLSVLVPQNCDGHVCSTIENLTDLDKFNTIVVVYNFITVGIFFSSYIFEMNREYWIIQTFDHNNTIPGNNLKQIIKKYPKIEKRLKSINNCYYIFSILLYFFIISNFILSGILVFSYYYNYQTVIVMLSDLALVSNKVHNQFMAARKCRKNNMAMSAYMNTNLVFNVLDKRFTTRSPMTPGLTPGVNAIPIEDIELTQMPTTQSSNSLVKLTEFPTLPSISF
jgi:hypothetical protein